MEEIRARLVDRTGKGVADAVARAIHDEALREGDKLLPIRAVAAHLQLSPTTISAAWSILARAGMIHPDGRRGTVIAATGGPGPARYRRALTHATGFELDLSTGLPDSSLLPDLAAALRSARSYSRARAYLDEPILPELAEVLRTDWPYDAERIAMTDGAMDAHEQIVAAFVSYGDRVAVEDPGFPPLLDLLEARGARLVAVPMDSDGLRPSGLEAAIASDVRALFLQPRAHNPTGISMSLHRVERLTAILRDTDLLVVENDSAAMVSSCQLHSFGRHLPDRTIYVRSFSKSHSPELRLAAMSGPRRLVDQLIERRRLGQGWTSRLLQAVLLDLLTRTTSIRQIERARIGYAERRSLLSDALQKHGINVPVGDGLNMWLPVEAETEAIVRLASRGIGAAAGGPFGVRREQSCHLRVTAGLVANEHERVAGELAEAALLAGWAGG